MDKVTITVENHDKTKRAIFTLDSPDGDPEKMNVKLTFDPEAVSLDTSEDYANVTALILGAIKNA